MTSPRRASNIPWAAGCETRRPSDHAGNSIATRRYAHWSNSDTPHGGPTFFKQADRTAWVVCTSGRHCHRERTAAQRVAAAHRRSSEALEQQTATSEVLKVISSSAGELRPVFQTMLERAVRICGAKFGNLLLVEGDAFRHVALHGASQAYLEKRRREPVIRPRPGSDLDRIRSTKQIVHVADMQLEGPATPAIIELAGARTLLNVPMLKDNELIGAIGIYRQEVRPFTNKQIALLQILPRKPSSPSRTPGCSMISTSSTNSLNSVSPTK